MSSFKIYKKNEKQIIERLKFPRFTAEITFGQMLDNCTDVMMLARAMREAGEYIIEQSR
jgi:hypothetical protein